MAGSLGEFGPSQSDRTPELLRQKEQPDTQKYILVWTGFGELPTASFAMD